ncbi:hypothetical protein MKW92_040771 [Papaver armeniacum]|nr:hypothetical protein MKW92_040771 [Papaver armeniacum]
MDRRFYGGDFRYHDEFGNYIGPERKYEYDEDNEQDDVVVEEDEVGEYEDEELEDDEAAEENGKVLTESDEDDLIRLMSDPLSIRNVALVGQLGHGKTVFMDKLVIHTHYVSSDELREVATTLKPILRFTDTTVYEKVKQMSIKAIPMSFVLKDSDAKSYLCNIIDTPGHVDFNDEMTAALRLADGAVLIVDATEGVMLNTRRAIYHAIKEKLPIVLVINKIDMLITKLELSPNDAYRKLRSIIEEVNFHITAVSSTAGGAQTIDPLLGNVCFASASAGWSFTLQSFAKLYVKRHRGVPISALEFGSQLWGDKYFNPDTQRFSGEPPHHRVNRSFVQLILEPLYKIYDQVSTERQASVLQQTFGILGVKLPDSAYDLTFSLKLRLACSSVFGSVTGFTDMLVQHIPSAKEAAASKVENIFGGAEGSPAFKAIMDCDPSGPLMVNVTKLYPRKSRYGTVFDALGRVYSGEIQTGQTVQVLRDDYSPDDGDEEDIAVTEVSRLWVYQARYRIPVSRAPAGSLVLIEGVGASIDKTATLTHVDDVEEAYPFEPLRFNTLPVVKTVIEPFEGSRRPSAMCDGLRMIIKTYPLATVLNEKNMYPQKGAEESFESTISGTGKLYLECILWDLTRHSQMGFKVADPDVSFRETVEKSSSVKCFADNQNRITMIAEPLEKGLVEDIENGDVSMSQQSLPDVWAFGSDKQEPNILLADTIANEVDNSLLNDVKDLIVQGFQWATRAGPLCDEPIRNVRFRIVDTMISPEPLHRSIVHIMRTAERAAFSAFLMASPRLMEPVYYVEIQTPIDLVPDIMRVLSLRRGNVMIYVPQSGTPPPYIVKALLPVIESFRFATDLKQITGTRALCLFVFDHWDIVPGDPLQAPALIVPGEPLETPTLAREFVLKTRRRKDDVSISKLID